MNVSHMSGGNIEAAHSAIATKGFDVGFVNAFDRSESGTENRGIVFVHTFFDDIWRLVLILFKC